MLDISPTSKKKFIEKYQSLSQLFLPSEEMRDFVEEAFEKKVSGFLNTLKIIYNSIQNPTSSSLDNEQQVEEHINNQIKIITFYVFIDEEVPIRFFKNPDCLTFYNNLKDVFYQFSKVHYFNYIFGTKLTEYAKIPFKAKVWLEANTTLKKEIENHFAITAKLREKPLIAPQVEVKPIKIPPSNSSDITFDEADASVPLPFFSPNITPNEIVEFEISEDGTPITNLSSPDRSKELAKLPMNKQDLAVIVSPDEDQQLMRQKKNSKTEEFSSSDGSATLTTNETNPKGTAVQNNVASFTVNHKSQITTKTDLKSENNISTSNEISNPTNAVIEVQTSNDVINNTTNPILQFIHDDNPDDPTKNLTSSNLHEILQQIINQPSEDEREIQKLKFLNDAFEKIKGNWENKYPVQTNRYIFLTHNQGLTDQQISHIKILKCQAAIIGISLAKKHRLSAEDIKKHAKSLIEFNTTRCNMFTKIKGNLLLSEHTQTEERILKAAKTAG